ncbi:dTDP-4-dehydrorhamnose reductase [Flagellimonas olearia]|uniref:dTDP-4-dehydrorhamnose reductase n=1 Tax=Flagellimonas olearia TaxID=552546 RepID=A0A444VNL4_9FLAO|nr:dTDP-4-dehydrorhamnose reductase [Allomuricauda olearia]RYC52375.1 dTDP-4-dehydrorhamnose reductase [Allomuricauda olearia]
MKNIVVTGSDGQLGRTLKEFAQKAKNTLFDFKTSADLDITNEQLVSDLFKNQEYRYCINCAAYTNVEQAEKNPDAAYRVNSVGVKNLAYSCDAYGITLIHISTDYVFDGEKETPYSVEDEPNPINVYGKSKLKGEEYIRKTLPNHFIVRTSWLYSKKYGHNFYRTILRKALEGDDLRVTDDQKGCPTNTETLAKFILDEIIEGKKPYGTYHCTDGVPMTWYDFAQKILNENGLSDKANLVLDRNYRTFAKRPKNSVLS